jgi:hypothetical protein
MNRPLRMASIALLASLLPALADASNPRFQLHDVRAETAAPATRADGRYSVHARVELPLTEPPISATRFALKSASGVACEAAGDAVFADGFE